ncbi:MAG: Ribosomal RNA small subunit methyltransferase I [Chlamydiia bacterium]|nr:Ribosomal RNA small subunit methyltransferase I [Chlamydiia bacterium]
MTLYLLPNLLSEAGDISMNIPAGLENLLYSLDGFFVETPKEIRKFFKNFDFERLRDKPMEIVDKHTDDFSNHINFLKKGERWGLVSDCGLPCIADPGARLVLLAKKENVDVEAVAGPSSIFLAIMLSGLYSQRFTFYGYMPRKIDKKIRKDKYLQVYIQTPYKTEYTLQDLIEVLDSRDMLSVALDIGAPTQEVITDSVKNWQNMKWPELRKRPAVFLIQCR